MNYQRGKKRGEKRVWICRRQFGAHTAGEVEPSADVQASHCSLVLLLKLEGGSVSISSSQTPYGAASCGLTHKSFSILAPVLEKQLLALEKQLQHRCCGGVLGARAAVGSLGWNICHTLLSLLQVAPIMCNICSKHSESPLVGNVSMQDVHS